MLSLNVMRRLDSWLGWPAATLLGLVPRRQRPVPHAPREIVVVKLSGLGSLLVCASVLRALRAAQPQARLTVVAFDNTAAAARLMPEVDDVLAISTAGPAALLRTGLQVWHTLRCRRPDVIADIEYFSKLSTVFCALSNARHRLGFRLPARWRERLLDSGIAFREDIHFRDNVARLFHPFGVDYRQLPRTALRIPPAAHQAAAALLATDGAAPVVWAAVNPHATALCPQRRWPLARFASVITDLLRRHPALHIVIPGTADERPRAEALRQSLPAAERDRVRVLAGETDLPTLAAVLQQCRLVLTNDTGILHLAAAVDAPLVALFGPESPVRYGPCDATRARVLVGGVPCGPCLSYMNHKRAPCGDGTASSHIRKCELGSSPAAACMLAITVADVLHACEALLADQD